MPNNVILEPIAKFSRHFIPTEFDGEGGDPYRCMTPPKHGMHRALHAEEIAALVKNNNTAESWDEILVTDAFNPSLVFNCEFFGRVCLGDLEPLSIEYNDLRLPVGLRNSTIVSCRIGDNVAIRDVHYLAHYVIGDHCILFNIDEMLCTNHAKFGNGIVKEGEAEDVRIWLEICNESAGRRILPFEGLLPADAWIWSRHRDDADFLSRLVAFTEARCSAHRGFYGEVGDRSVLKDCGILKDVKVGTDAYVKGAGKLKNITILSSAEESTQIGEGVELVNGIVGYGNRIFYEAKAIRFVTGRNVQLKYGARLLNSVLGDNSTVSCCEILNNLVFPFHEQHHNNSFLVAATVLGQSNIAAGATIGSNHNSRAPDGEIVAGRGFWPGLCTSFKHDSRFASFSLVAKGSYSYELDIRYPFSLVFLDRKDDAVHVMPAYWFVHNMYAMARNSWKFAKRDTRRLKEQNIETDYLAPDTAQEMLDAMERLELLAARAAGGSADLPRTALRQVGRNLLAAAPGEEAALEDPEAMKRFGGRIERPGRGWRQYRDFTAYFGVKTFLDRFPDPKAGLEGFLRDVEELYREPLAERWTNLGGQIVPAEDAEALRADVVSGRLDGWDAVHGRYNELWAAYPRRKARYGLFAIEQALDVSVPAMDREAWRSLLASMRTMASSISEAAHASRRKDYEDPFRRMVYESEAEMEAVVGSLDDNPFLEDLRRRTEAFVRILTALLLE